MRGGPASEEKARRTTRSEALAACLAACMAEVGARRSEEVQCARIPRGSKSAESCTQVLFSPTERRSGTDESQSEVPELPHQKLCATCPPMAQQITAEADSESWVHQKENVARITDAYIAQSELKKLVPTKPRGSLWDELSENVVCARPFYEGLSTFLVHIYVIPEGKKNAGFPLAELSVRNYLGTAINRAGNKFRAGGSTATKEFFFCLDSNSSHESAEWFRKLKKKTTRTIFERAKVNGEAHDNSESAPPPRSAPVVRSGRPLHVLTLACPLARSTALPGRDPPHCALIRALRQCGGGRSQVHHPDLAASCGAERGDRMANVGRAQVGLQLRPRVRRVAAAQGVQGEARSLRCRLRPALRLVPRVGRLLRHAA